MDGAGHRGQHGSGFDGISAQWRVTKRLHPGCPRMPDYSGTIGTGGLFRAR